MSNRLDPDQARHLVGPDLGPNCLQSLSADDSSRQSKVPIITATDDKNLISFFVLEANAPYTKPYFTGLNKQKFSA